MKKHVTYTCKTGKLIHIGTEQLRNERYSFTFHTVLIILLLGAIFEPNLTN